MRRRDLGMPASSMRRRILAAALPLLLAGCSVFPSRPNVPVRRFGLAPRRPVTRAAPRGAGVLLIRRIRGVPGLQELGLRKGELLDMQPDGRGRVRLEYRIPARGLIGFQGEFLNLTRGTGLMSHIFDGYEPYKGDIGGRKNGVLISQDDGEIVTYALGKLDDRGRMFVKPGDPVYEGMIVGIHSRDNDLVVNAVRTKQLTNFRVSGKEDAIKITPPIVLTLEYAVEFIDDDELVEITPTSIRLRKRFLKEHERKRASREAA